MINLMICDDHVLVSEGIELMIQSEDDLIVRKVVSSGQEALDYLGRPNQIDILILDLSMPDMSGNEVLQMIRSLSIDVKVLILTMHENIEHLKKAMALNAEGYLLKNTNKKLLVKVLRIIADGGSFIDHKLTEKLILDANKKPKVDIVKAITLTERELDILRLIIKNYRTKEIADALYISVNTVQSHKKNIYSKFDVHSVSELITYVYENNFLQD